MSGNVERRLRKIEATQHPGPRVGFIMASSEEEVRRKRREYIKEHGEPQLLVVMLVREPSEMRGAA